MIRFAFGRKKKPTVDAAAIESLKAALGQRSIVMVGLMGCGKSAIGKRLAAALSVPFVDADEEIERAAGKTITEIFDDQGEPFFRERERKVISRLLQSGTQVLATGGGAFMNEETRESIRKSGVSVWLKADLPVLLRRVAKRDTRPLLRRGDPEVVMRQLIETRYPVYAQADVTVESRDVPHEVIVTDIIRSLQRLLLPAPGGGR